MLKIEVNHYFHFPEGVSGPSIREMFHRILEEMKGLKMADQAIEQGLTDLGTDVEGLTTVVGSAEALISGFAQQLADAIQAAKDAGASPEQIQKLSDLHSALSSKTAELAAAVAAATPGQPDPNA